MILAKGLHRRNTRCTKPEKLVRSAMGDLLGRLSREFRRTAEVCAGPLDDPVQAEPLTATLTLWGRATREIRACLERTEELDAQAACEILRERQEEVSRALGEAPLGAYLAREVLTRLLALLARAEAEVAPRLECATPSGRKVVVTSDVLYEVHYSLLPAERMLVVAGHRDGNVTALGAGFEVTGDYSGASVRADPARLARALIAMDLSGTHLAAWMHSHPGTGPRCTHPSHIDLNQHRDWIRDYTVDLLSAIVVADGWIRFWGAALQADRIRVEVVGPGVAKEDGDDHLYRLAQ